MPPDRKLNRIIIVGSSCSGKSTLARQLSERLGMPHVELDALHWAPNWTEAPIEVFRARVAEAVAGDRWVVDGNYGVVRDITWQRADTVVWLDFRLHVLFWRLTIRTFQRWWRRELLWGTNRERLWDHFFTRESLYWWILKTHGRRKREYPELLANAQGANITAVRLRSPCETASWIGAVSR